MVSQHPHFSKPTLINFSCLRPTGSLSPTAPWPLCGLFPNAPTSLAWLCGPSSRISCNFQIWSAPPDPPLFPTVPLSLGYALSEQAQFGTVQLARRCNRLPFGAIDRSRHWLYVKDGSGAKVRWGAFCRCATHHERGSRPALRCDGLQLILDQSTQHDSTG